MMNEHTTQQVSTDMAQTSTRPDVQQKAVRSQRPRSRGHVHERQHRGFALVATMLTTLSLLLAGNALMGLRTRWLTADAQNPAAEVLQAAADASAEPASADADKSADAAAEADDATDDQTVQDVPEAQEADPAAEEESAAQEGEGVTTSAEGESVAPAPADAPATDAPTSDDVPADTPTSSTTHSLAATLDAPSGARYELTLFFEDDAQIPEDATLALSEVVRKPSTSALAKRKNGAKPYDGETWASLRALGRRASILQDALALEAQDYLFEQHYLQLSLTTADGRQIQPAAPVTLSLRSDALAEDASDAYELVVLSADAVAAATDAKTSLASLQAGTSWHALSTSNYTTKGHGVELEAQATELGELAIAGVARVRMERTVHGGILRVLAPAGTTLEASEAALPEFDEGVEGIEALQLRAKADETAAPQAQVELEGTDAAAAAGTTDPEIDPATGAPTYGQRLWVSFEPAAEDAGMLGGLVAYRLRDGQIAGTLLTATATKPAMLATGDAIALAWDTGYRQTTLATKASDAKVTIAGMLPTDAEATAQDVSADYADPEALLEGVPDAIEPNKGEMLASVAYDITLSSEAAATTADAPANADTDYQPGEERPVQVTIDAPELAAALEAGARIQVLHVADDGTATPVEATAGKDGRVSFEATGFSAYVVVYTVDFHWGGDTYSVPGGTTIFLSELLDALDVSDFTCADVVRASFSDSSLVQVEQVDIIDAAPELTETDTTEELVEHTHTDWRIVSLAPFTSEETLTLTLTDGSTVEIPVTDDQFGDVYGDETGETVTAANNAGTRFTADGVTYQLRTAGGTTYADVYAITAGCIIHNKILFRGNTYSVNDIDQGVGNLTRKKSKFDWALVERAADHKIELPAVVVDPSEDPTAEGYVAGEKNDETGNLYKVWKKATYDEATNTITYAFKFFQSMKRKEWLDFIFIYDDSASMYSGTRNSGGVRMSEAQVTRVLLLNAANALFEANASNDGQDYDFRVYLGGTSTGDDRNSMSQEEGGSNGFTTYDQVLEYLSTYNTGVTDYTVGLANAYAMARNSRDNGRTPVVVWLSDFHQALAGNRLRRTGDYAIADQLHAVTRVYGLSTDHTWAGSLTVRDVCTDEDTVFSMRPTDASLADGVISLEELIKHAIGYYMDDKVSINDNLSSGLASLTPTNGMETEGTQTPHTGSEMWQLGGGSNPPTAGEMYSETFTVALPDDQVYTGAMPTNGTATVYVGGSKVNEVDPDKLPLGKSVTFLVGRMDEKENKTADENGVPTNLIQSDLQFTLTEQDGDETLGTYTVTNGSFSIPFERTVGDGDEQTSEVVLELGHTYILSEQESSVNTYNSAASRNPANLTDPMLKAPDKNWIVRVADNGVVTVMPEADAGQTPETTIAKASSGNPPRIVLWNAIVVPAQLIPLTLTKTWSGGETRDSVPFTIYGVERAGDANPGTRHKLVAYDRPDAVAGKVVKYIGPGNRGFSKDGDVWTQTVYVLNKEDGHTFYDYTGFIDLSKYSDNATITLQHGGAGGSDLTLSKAQWGELDEDGDGKIPYGQSYSYAIEEGDLVYEDGWYTPTYDNNATATTLNVSEGNVPAQSADTTKSWISYVEDYGGTTSDDLWFELDIYNYVYGEADKEDFRNTLGMRNNDYTLNANTEKESFFEKLRSLELVIQDTGKDDTYYRLTVPVSGTYNTSGDSNYSLGAAVFGRLRLPSAWSNYPNGRYGQIPKNSLEVKEVYATFNNGKGFVIYSSGPGTDAATGIAITRKTSVSNTGRWGLHLQDNRYNPDHWHSTALFNLPAADFYYDHYDVATLTPSSQTLEIYAKRPGSPAQTVAPTSYTLNSCTLDITNTWNPNKLIPVEVVKNWKDGDTDPATDYAEDTYGVKQDVNFTLSGTTTAGTKQVPIFTSADAAWETGTETGTIALADNDADAAQWTTTVYVPTYDVLGTYDSATRTCEKYTYAKNADDLSDEEISDIQANFHEAEITADTDADGQPKGEWTLANPVEFSQKSDTVIRPAETSEYSTYRIPLDVNHEYTQKTTTSPKVFYLDQSQLNPITKFSFSFNYVDENGDSQQATYELNWSDEPKDFSYYDYMLQNLKFPKEWKLGSITEIKLNGNSVPFTSEFITTGTNREHYLLGQVKFINNSNSISGFHDVQTNISEQIIYTSESSTTTYDLTFTLTNTYTPYKAVTLTSTFTDDSADQASTGKIGRVVYSISGTTDDGEEYTREVVTNYTDSDKPSVTTSGEGADARTTLTATKTVYVPKGTYDITQTTYTIEGGTDRYPTTAYTTSAQFGSAAATATSSTGNQALTADTTVRFDNTRKQLPVTVRTHFAPEVTDADATTTATRPLAGRELKYTLSYQREGQADPVELSGDNYKLDDSAFVYGTGASATDEAYKNYRRTHATTDKIPAYSVRAVMTQCSLSGENVATALPDYGTYVDAEEKDGTLIFTIYASINRAPVIVSKSWDEDVPEADRANVELKFEVRRVNSAGATEAIYGKENGTLPLGLTLQTGDDGSLVGTFTLGKDEDQNEIYLPVLRDWEVAAGSRYVLTEVSATRGGVAQGPYYVTYTDLTADAANQFAQTNPSGTSGTAGEKTTNEATFVLTKSGILVDVNNAASPYICKIVETFGEGDNATQVEVPFRRLNKAVNYARTYGNGREMGAENPVAIEMLVDYAIPGASSTPDTPYTYNDRVVLDQATDNIVITTAATSGGVYNFTPTFTAAEGRATTDSEDAAIIKRNFDGASLISLTTGSKLQIEKVVLDGDRDRYTSNAEGGLVSADASSLRVTTGAVLRNSKTSGRGGAIGISGGTLTVDGDAQILNCEAVHGGGIHTGDSRTTATIGGTALIDQCTAAYGGGINIEGNKSDGNSNRGVTATISGGTVQDCSATVQGGGVNVEGNDNGATLNLTGGTIGGSGHGNTAPNGGGIYVEDKGELNFSGGSIQNNTATSSGGGIEASGAAAIDMTAGAISGNVAQGTAGGDSGRGGGVHLCGSATMSMSGGTISGNKVTGGRLEGGGVYASTDGTSDGEFTLSGGTISGNEAGNGAGIFVGYDAAVSISGGEVSGNKASTAGGGIYNWGNTAVEISGGTIKNNEAPLGAAYGDNGGNTLRMSGGSMTGNTATADNGGAINVGNNDSRLYFSGNAKVKNNTNTATDTSTKHNVVLSLDTNDVIQTTKDGLGNNAEIGVYVIGDMDASSGIFYDHGGSGDPFGTLVQKSDNNPNAENNLHKFTNDRNGLFAQAGQKDSTRGCIVWAQPVRAYVYVNMDGMQDNREFMDMLGIKYFYANTWAPVGIVNLPASILVGKESWYNNLSADTVSSEQQLAAGKKYPDSAAEKGPGIITSKSNPDDWETAIEAIKRIDKSKLSTNEWYWDYNGTYPAANQNNTIDEYADAIIKHYGWNEYSGLFFFNRDDHYLYQEPSSSEDPIEYHMDLTFQTAKIKYVYGENGITNTAAKDGDTLDTRTYILNAEVPEPVSLREKVAAGYSIEGYYLDEAMTKPWHPWADSTTVNINGTSRTVGRVLNWQETDSGRPLVMAAKDGYQWTHEGSGYNSIDELTIYVKLREPSYLFLQNRSSNDYVYRVTVDYDTAYTNQQGDILGSFRANTAGEASTTGTPFNPYVNRSYIKRGSSGQYWTSLASAKGWLGAQGYTFNGASITMGGAKKGSLQTAGQTYFDLPIQSGHAETLYLPGASGLDYSVQLYKATITKDDDGDLSYTLGDAVDAMPNDNIKMNDEFYTVVEGTKNVVVYVSDKATSDYQNGSVGDTLIAGPSYQVSDPYDKDDANSSYETAVITDSLARRIVVVDEGFDVQFAKVDGSGQALAGATFTVYTTAEATQVKKRGSVDLTGTSAATANAEKGIAVGDVLIEKVPTGVWYLKERTAAGQSGAPDGYAANDHTYVVLVGTTALTRPDSPEAGSIWASDGILGGISAEQLEAQVGTGTNARRFAIFQLDEDGKAQADPDIRRFGIMNQTSARAGVVLRKVAPRPTGTEPAGRESLEGARFRIFRYDLSEIVDEQRLGNDGKPLGYYESAKGGVWYVGQLPQGTYYLLETKAPAGYDSNAGKVFKLEVGASGVTQQELGLATDSKMPGSSDDMAEALRTWAKKKE